MVANEIICNQSPSGTTAKQLPVLRTWTLTDVQRRNPARQVPKINFFKSGFGH
jgi:hypothetical protein